MRHIARIALLSALAVSVPVSAAHATNANAGVYQYHGVTFTFSLDNAAGFSRIQMDVSVTETRSAGAYASENGPTPYEGTGLSVFARITECRTAGSCALRYVARILDSGEEFTCDNSACTIKLAIAPCTIDLARSAHLVGGPGGGAGGFLAPSPERGSLFAAQSANVALTSTGDATGSACGVSGLDLPGTREYTGVSAGGYLFLVPPA